MALTLKQQMFIAAYLGEANGNATEAARIAGYSEPRQQGSRLLTFVDVSEEIERKFREKHITADEVLSRYADQAKGLGAYLKEDKNGNISIDFQSLKKDGKLHLIKSVKRDKFGQSIEFYDAQAALSQIGRKLKLFTDNVNHTGNVDLNFGNLDESELDPIIQRRIKGETQSDIPPKS